MTICVLQAIRAVGVSCSTASQALSSLARLFYVCLQRAKSSAKLAVPKPVNLPSLKKVCMGGV